MVKKCLLISFCSLILISGFAMGKRDVEEKSVEDLKSWQETVDLEDKKTGKYNVLITAEDMGGNITNKGPFNIFVDPESDRPVTTIVNPRSNMRVPGNLNIVGSCVDDDAVGSVHIILDGNRENEIIADGKDFWSYYLDTTGMEDGPHEIIVYGVDDKGIVGKEQKVVWNLDRRQPQISVESHEMGTLVSRKVKVSGSVYDGNGIDSLYYSLDRGQTYTPVSIKYDKKANNWDFSLTIDTQKMDDGAAVFWFKAVDGQGTEGYLTFLYFIDNTAPDIKIVYPGEKDVVNGLFTVAGYAKDDIAIESLVWNFGKQTGEIELTPGNPYWTLDIDLRGEKIKSETFSVTTRDTIGNQSTAKLKIAVDNDLDLAHIDLFSPSEKEAFDNAVLIRGIAKDDDGIAEVFFAVDNGETYSLPSEGVFSINLMDYASEPLSVGAHELQIWAKDIHGVEGKVLKRSFYIAGPLPEFSNKAIVKDGKTTEFVEAYQSGIEVNPESGTVFSFDIESLCGLSEVTWSFDGLEAQTKQIASVRGITKLTIPFADVWGHSQLIVTAKDIYGRKNQSVSHFYLTNLTKTQGAPEVIFSDYLDDANRIFLGKDAINGFFIGGKAKEVRFEPETTFASLSLVGNSIRIIPGYETGISEEVQVVVTTDSGADYFSETLRLYTPVAKPVIKTKENVFDAKALRVEGSIESALSIKTLSYRILYSKKTATDWQAIPFDGEGSFSLSLESSLFEDGASVVEIKAVDLLGTTATKGLLAKKIPVIEDPKKVNPFAKPTVFWLDGENLYYATIYMGALSLSSFTINSENDYTQTNPVFGQVEKDKLISGENRFDLTFTNEEEKPTSSRFSIKKDSIPIIRFVSAGDLPFVSGLEVPVSKKNLTKTETLKIEIESSFPISSAQYAFFNENPVKLALKKSPTEANIYTGEIPLYNLPAEIVPITFMVNSQQGKVISKKRTLSIVRPVHEQKIQDEKKVYWQAKKDNENQHYILKKGASLSAYINALTPLKVSWKEPNEALGIEVQNNTIYIYAKENGFYENLVLIATDAEGVELRSEPISIVVDLETPNLEIDPFEIPLWVTKTIDLSGRTKDDTGIKKVEYSLDAGESWVSLEMEQKEARTEQLFSKNIDISFLPEGLVSLDVRSEDLSGKKTMQSFAFHKDTEAPNVSVVLPYAADVVNGETTIVFAVEDKGKVEKAEYVLYERSEDEMIEVARNPIELDTFIITQIGTKEQPITNAMVFEFTDYAGNVRHLNSWNFFVEVVSDLPVVEVHIPTVNEIIREDFVVSGIVYDDDGPCRIWYAIDDEEFILLTDEYANGFSIDIPLSRMTDNEHIVTVYAEDLYGVIGDPIVRPFRISLEEPKGSVITPYLDETVKDRIEVSGTASDKNGIKKIEISVDNGITYADALGTEEWSYSFDTKILEDGSHVVFIKVWDNYDIEALYSSILNVDNTKPHLELEHPVDNSVTTGKVLFSGQTTDNIGLEKLYIRIKPLAANMPSIPTALSRFEFIPGEIINTSLDLSGLSDGFYNVELSGEDAAGNVSRISRNIQLTKDITIASIDILYPLTGETVQGMFNLYGQVQSEYPMETVILFINEQNTATAEVTDSGYFMFTLSPEDLLEGTHKIQIRGIVEGTKIITSEDHYIHYTPNGPWVTIDNFIMGDFAFDRPFLEGSSGYAFTEEEMLALKDKNVSKEEKNAIQSKAVDYIDLSFDNGKTFKRISAKKKWRYRIENEDMAQGAYYLMVRAVMENGESAVTKTIVQIDKTAPVIKLISPEEGGRFNEQLEIAGLSSDDIALKSLDIAFRKGDKSTYEVPTFIQGLYLDWHFWGATLFDIGVGLTFFDDNVRLQAQFGQFTPTQWKLFVENPFRYGGNVFGGKILANVGNVPFRYFFGPNWAWLSANFTIGANFSIFSLSQSGKPQILSAVLGQVEFPRVTIPKQKMFGTFAFYTEVQLWFIPTDVEAGDTEIDSLVPQISVGLRANVF